MISIVDYGLGNLQSIQNMLSHIGRPSVIAKTPDDLKTATHIILPGVGAFDYGIKTLQEQQWIPALEQAVFIKNLPILGICLGMQLLFDRSEEGQSAGLGWISGNVQKFNFSQDTSPLKIPHMGWNIATPMTPQSPLFQNLPDSPRFYFVHSYYVVCQDTQNICATTSYGTPFTSAVQKNNIYGVQFHPEKSHKFGMAVLLNFTDLKC